MHLFLKLHQIAAEHGDGLRPEWLELMTGAMSADGFGPQPPALKVVQPGNHPDGVAVVPPEKSVASSDQTLLKAVMA